MEEQLNKLKIEASKLSLTKEYEKAGDTYFQAYKELTSFSDMPKMDKIEALKSAITCYKRAPKLEYIINNTKDLYFKLLELYEHDNERQAKIYEEIAVFYEENSDVFSVDETKYMYNQALIYYVSTDKNKSKIEKINLKMIEYYTDDNDYNSAIDIYEELLEETNHKSVGYIVNLILCYLAIGDCVRARNKLSESSIVSILAGVTYHNNFLNSLLESIEIMDICAFSDACYLYDKIMILKPLQVKILCYIKKISFEDKEIDLC